jgi:hypothetical protein
MPDDVIGGDVGHQFVALVKALLPIEAERECDAAGDIAGIGGFELVIHGSWRIHRHENISRTKWTPVAKIVPFSRSSRLCGSEVRAIRASAGGRGGLNLEPSPTRLFPSRRREPHAAVGLCERRGAARLVRCAADGARAGHVRLPHDRHN